MGLFSPKGGDGATAENSGHDTLSRDDVRDIARRCDQANPGVVTSPEEVAARRRAAGAGEN